MNMLDNAVVVGVCNSLALKYLLIGYDNVC